MPACSIPALPLMMEEVPLREHCTLRLGGPARFFISCCSVEELRAGLRWAGESGLPVLILGGGSNLVFRDDGFPGLVLKIALRGRRFEPEGSEVLATAAAGEEWDGLVRECVQRGLAGVEALSGVPGLVGATPIQNAGAYGQEVCETIVAVRVLDRNTLQETVFRGEECEFRYRQSRFKGRDLNRYVVTSVTFRLVPNGRPAVRYAELEKGLAERGAHPLGGGRTALAAVRETVLALRRRKAMLADPDEPEARSVGSFFENPILDAAGLAALEARGGGMAHEKPAPLPVYKTSEGFKVPAAWLIEQAGFRRGLRRGGVGISSRHALALVNLNGTARELLALAEEIRAGVRARFGVQLELEPAVVPA